MEQTKEYIHEPEDAEQLSAAVVTAVAKAHDEDVLDQLWVISEDINTDALDRLFQENHLKMTLQFEADGTTATIVANKNGNPIITIESHR